ncbi:MAG TPA: hypothetical protein VMZ25_04310 [Terriglobales bacterium]|nr:hypothetical protein [Terriglobales bacterium]
MLRILTPLALLLLTLTASAQHQPDPKPQAKIVPETLVRSKYVYVGILRADGRIDDRINPATAPEDRQVRDAVETAFRGWKRYIVTLLPDHADLIVLVRKGRLGSVTLSGTPVQLSGGGGRADTRPRSPDDVRRSTDEDLRANRGVTVGAEAGPLVDIMEVHTGPNAGGSDLRLWQRARQEGFTGTPPRLFQQFKDEVEAAAKKLGL